MLSGVRWRGNLPQFLIIVCVFQMAKVPNCFVWGDSHVRRISEQARSTTGYFDRFDIFTVSFRFLGGATVSKLRRQGPGGRYDLIVLSVGGNDLDNGAQPLAVIAELRDLARSLLIDGSAKKVVCMSAWPRANAAYAARQQEFNCEAQAHFRDPILNIASSPIEFWFWSRKLKYHLAPDGVHMTPAVYRRAQLYTASVMLWFAKYVFGYYW